MSEKKKMTFEESVKRLEEIVQSLETGKSNLEESLTLFSEGVELVKVCNKMLDEAEQKVRVLTDDGNGHMVEKEMD